MLKAVPEGVRGYAGALISSQQAAEKLAKAQDNLNKITKQYDDQLKPITGRLKEIQAERDAFTQQQRIGELNQIVTDATASGDTDAVRFAQLELEEIALQNQQSAIEENRDAAVDAATQKVDAAQAEMDAAEKRLELERELLQHQIETNNLLADTIAKVNELGGGAGGGLAGAASAATSLTEAMTGIGNIAAPLDSTMSGLAESIMGEFDGIGESAGELGETWSGVASGLIERGGKVVAWWQTNFGEGGVWPGIMSMASSIFQSQWGEGGTWEGNMKNLQKIGQALADWWLEIWGEDGVWAGIMENATTIFNEQWGEGGVWSGIADNMQLIISYIKDEFEQKLDLINDKVLKAKEFIHNLLEKAQEFYDWIKDKVFDFKITWPELPEWMQTNSPMVLHTRAKDFKRFLDGSTFDFDIQSNDLEGVTNNMLDHAALATAGANVNQPFNMYGNVNNGMSERELETKVRRWIKDENRKR
jgi:uncharacterized protein YfkK (UPF0435 family)